MEEQKEKAPLKIRALRHLYGRKYFEYYFLDSVLDMLSDGKPISGENVWGKLPAGNRVFSKLLSDGYLCETGDTLQITSEGLLFIGSGGYSSRFLQSKRSSVGFWISIISLVIACASFIISLCRV